jgi:hypothetical protein
MNLEEMKKKFGFKTPKFSNSCKLSFRDNNGFVYGLIDGGAYKWMQTGTAISIESGMICTTYNLEPIKPKNLRERIQELAFDLNTIKWGSQIRDDSWDLACDKIRKELMLILEETDKGDK